MKFSKVVAIFVSVVALAQPLLMTQVSAQTPYRGVVVRLPATAERYLQINLSAGETYKGSFIVQHEYEDKTKQVHLYVYASDFVYDNNSETVSYPDDSLSVGGSYSLSKWVKFDHDELTLDHYGQEETVNFTITVPRDATAGARYANIIVSNSPLLSAEDKKKLTQNVDGAAIVTRLVVTTLLITVNGDRQQNVYLEDVHMTDGNGDGGLLGSNIFEFHPVDVKFKLRNMGNQILLPGGDVFIHTGDITNPVDESELNPYHERLVPNSQRTFSVEWSDSSFKLNKNGTVSVDLQHFFNFHWGHYYAQINMLYRDVNGKLTVIPGTVDFWVLPWKPVAILLLLIGVIVGYGVYRRRTGVVFVSRDKQIAQENSKRAKVVKKLKQIRKFITSSISGIINPAKRKPQRVDL